MLLRPGQPVVSAGSRERAGRLTLRLYGSVDPIAKRARRVTVALRVSAPGARTTVLRHVHVPVVRRAAPPVPPPLDVRARRSGHDVIVTWRTAIPARHITFGVGAVDRDSLPLAGRSVLGRGRRAFRVRLRRAAAAARRVIVSASGPGGRQSRRVTVRIV
jgi:hypothetical protein